MVRALDAHLGPCRQSNSHSEGARLEHQRSYGEKVIGRDREARVVCSQMAFARRSSEPGRWPLACGWSAIVAADRPVDSPVLGRQDPRSWRSGSPEGKRVVSSLTLGRGHFSPRPPGLATFPARARYQGQEGSAEESSSVLTARRSNLGAVGPERFDSQRAGGYSPLDFPLFGRFVLGFLETERDRGGAVYAEPRSRWSTRPGDGSDTQGEIPGNAWR